MIIFIPSWENISEQGLSSDDLMGQIKSFMLNNENYKVLIPDYLPSLRHFLHRYDLLECNFISLFDQLQGADQITQKNISIESLNFPKESQYFYTPFHILVYFQEEYIGKITFSEGGCITEVYYYKQNLDKIEIYDDRGFLSSYTIYREGKVAYTNFLDYEGKSIFKLYPEGFCIVNPNNSKKLKEKKYESLEALKQEYISEILYSLKDLTTVVVSINQNNLQYINQSEYGSKVIASFFQERVSNIEEVKQEIQILSTYIKKIIVDSNIQKKLMEKVINKENIIEVITPYDTRFELSRTQEQVEELIYIDARNISFEETKFIIQEIFRYIVLKSNLEESQRKFRIIFRLINSTFIKEASSVLDNELKKFSPKLFTLLENFEVMGEALEMGLDIIKDNIVELQELQKLQQTFEFLTISSDEELYKIMNEARLVIDVSQEPDLFTQIAAISAGLPQINSKHTEYVLHQKNGLVIEELEELTSAIEYYLENLMYWQQARVYAVKQIKKYSGSKLRKKILSIAGELNGE